MISPTLTLSSTAISVFFSFIYVCLLRFVQLKVGLRLGAMSPHFRTAFVPTCEKGHRPTRSTYGTHDLVHFFQPHHTILSLLFSCCSVATSMTPLSCLLFLLFTISTQHHVAMALNFRLHGVNYSLRIGADWEPYESRCKTMENALADMNQLKQYTNNIRTFSLSECDTGNILLEATQEAGLGLWLGIWIGPEGLNFAEERAQLMALIQSHSFANVVGIHVSSEAIYRGDLTVDQAIQFRNDIKVDLVENGLPFIHVTIADILATYVANPDLVVLDDSVVHFNQFPFWRSDTDINNAAATMERTVTALQNIGDRKIVIGETGWPDAGFSEYANPANPPSMRKWLRDFFCLAEEQEWEYYWFIAYDSDWQRLNGQNPDSPEGHFGLFNEDGTLKSFLEDFSIDCSLPKTVINEDSETFSPMPQPNPTDPPVVLPPTDAPAVVLPPTDAPAVVLPPTDAPAAVFPPTDDPVVVLPPTDAPAVVPPTDAPAVVLRSTDAPVVVVPPTDAPVVVLPPTDAPVLPTDAPVVLPPTDAPVVLPPTDAPVVLPPTDAPVVLPPTDAPVVLPPTDAPTAAPTPLPSLRPSQSPSETPASVPSASPSAPARSGDLPTDTAAPTPTSSATASPTASNNEVRGSPTPTPFESPAETSSPTESPVVSEPSDSTPDPSIAPSPSPLAGNTATVSTTTIQDLQLTLVGVSTLNDLAIDHFVKTTEQWYLSVYGSKRFRRSLQEITTLDGFDTEVIFKTQALADQGNRITYTQDVSYNDASVDALDVISNPFENDALRSDYYGQLMGSDPVFANVDNSEVPDLTGAQILGSGSGDNDYGNMQDLLVIVGLCTLASILILAVTCFVLRRRRKKVQEVLIPHYPSVDYGREKPPNEFMVGGDDVMSLLDVPSVGGSSGAEHSMSTSTSSFSLTQKKDASLVTGVHHDEKGMALTLFSLFFCETADYDYPKIRASGGNQTVVSNAVGTMGENTRQDSSTQNSPFTESRDESPWAKYGAQYADENNIYSVEAPPGKLGVVVDTPDDGPPVIFAVKDTSSLRGKISVGDRLLAIDGENVASLSAASSSRLISEKSQAPVRLFTLLRTQKHWWETP